MIGSAVQLLEFYLFPNEGSRSANLHRGRLSSGLPVLPEAQQGSVLYLHVSKSEASFYKDACAGCRIVVVLCFLVVLLQGCDREQTVQVLRQVLASCEERRVGGGRQSASTSGTGF